MLKNENYLSAIQRSTILFFLLITVQVLVVLSQNPPSSFHGDEGGFVSKALYIKNNSSFPPPSLKHRDILHGDSWGWSDFKPPGMSLYVIPFFAGIGAEKLSDLSPSQYKTVRNRLYRVQTGMAVCTICIVFFFFVTKVHYKKSLAILIGLQPWAFYLTGSFLALVVTNFLLSVGLFTLGYLIVNKNISDCSGWVVFSIVFVLSLLILFRPDYFPAASALIVVFIVMVLKQANKRLLAFSISGIFLMAVTGNIGYRLFMDGEFRIYGEVLYPYKGLCSWNETWINDQQTRYAIQGIAANRTFSTDRLPDRAFASDNERNQIIALFEQAETKGYNEQIDKRFGEIASEKKAKNWLRCFLFPKTLQFMQIIFHTETNRALLLILTEWPATLRRALLIAFHAIKVLTVLLWFLAFPTFIFRWHKKMIDQLDWFGFILASVAVIKYLTVLAGISITHAGPEGRLLLGGLPAILGSAAYTLSRVRTRSK